MAHNLDITAGTATALFAREDAWHKLGTTLPDAFTAEDAMDIGHLGGWNVRKAPLTLHDASPDDDAEVAILDVPDRWATVRTNPINGRTDYLGVVGKSYSPIQNEEHCELLNALVGESGAHFDTAGALCGGRQVFITMKLPETMLIGGVDQLDVYIAALNSHDGTSAFRLMTTPVRIVCANTQAAALRDNSGVFSIRHTTGAKSAILEARRSLGLTFKYLEDFQAEADKMIQETLTEADFHQIITDNFGPEDSANATSRLLKSWAEEEATLMSLFADAQTNAGIRNTVWSGYQTCVEYLDHFAPARGDDVALARATRNLFGQDAGFKTALFDLFAVA